MADHNTVTTEDGADLWVCVEGHGPSLMLLSGLGGTASFWSPLVPFLSERFKIVRFDQRGIGQSSRGRTACTIAQLAVDALCVLNKLECNPAIVLGHSTGGCIAQQMAVLQPDYLRGLILSGTWLRPNLYMQRLFQLRLATLQNPEIYAAQSVFMSYPPDWLNGNWGVLDRAVSNAPKSEAARLIVAERIAALLAYDGTSFVPDIRTSAFVLGAKDDMIVPAILQAELAASMQFAQLFTVPDGGHFFPISRSQTFTTKVTEVALRWC